MAGAVIAGLARGWPEGRPASLDAGSEETLGRLLPRLAPEARGALVGLANRWGAKGLERYTAEIAGTLLAQASDESRPDEARIDAARQYVELRKKDPDAARELIALVTPRTPPALATALIEAAGRSEAPGVGAILVDRLGALTPGVRPVALRALLGRGDWTAALLEGVEGGKVRLDELSLDQKQALAAHPDAAIAGRAKRLLSRGGGLPDPDRQKVIDELAPIVLRGGDAARGKEVFRQQCAKCHAHSGEGGKVGPDLTGMAAHPKEELLVHILDPSRSVEGNFVQYTVATTDGRVLNGLLASETKTAVELIDAEGKAHVVQRADIDELVSSKKSLMPEGFEKQVTPAAIADLLAFLTARGKFLPLDLRAAATAVSTRGMFFDADDPDERLIFSDWSPKTFEGVPFLLVDPRGDRVPNAILLHGPKGTFPPKMPRSVELRCGTPAQGGPPPGRGERVGVPAGRERVGLADRPPALRRRDDRGPPLAQRGRARRLHPPGRRARLEARLPARRAAAPLPGGPPEADRTDRSDRAGQGAGRHRPGRHGGHRRGRGLSADRVGALSPSPRGRRCPEGADEGAGFDIDNTPEDVAGGSGTPHPAVPATVSRGEKESGIEF